MNHGLVCKVCGSRDWDEYCSSYDFGGRYDGRAVYKHWCPRTGREYFEHVGEDPGKRFNDGDTFNYLNRPIR